MYIRLKQRLLFYTLLLLIIALFGKMISIHNECNQDAMNSHYHGNKDPWNINEHLIEIEVGKVINKMRRRSGILIQKPIGVPELQHAGVVHDVFQSKPAQENSDKPWGPHQLGIIVPYRDRFEELKEFVPYIHQYLNEKKINHKIFVMNQIDQHRFNRASLINIGFIIARNESCDYIAMHDVDLVPVNKELNYGYPELGPFHVSGPALHPKYHYDTFVGGILLVSVSQFEELNGLSNKFWGWGREDDEFYMRIVEKGYKIFRHGAEIKTGYNTFKHYHGKERKRDYVKLPGQRKAMFERDLFTGLHNVDYEIRKRQELYIDGSHCLVIDVAIHCDKELTPWCDLPVKHNKPRV